MKLFQSPYADDMLRHPLFHLDVRAVSWAWPPRRFWQYSRRILLVVHAVIFLLWALLSVLDAANNPFEPPDYRFSQYFLVNNVNFFYFVMFVAIAANTLLDFRSLQLGLKTINGEITAGRWDLLRLTALHERGIVRAKHAGARLRVWRMTMVIVSARLATVTIGLFAALVAPYLFTGENIIVEGLLDSFIREPLPMLVVLMIGAVTAAVYAVEPFWRMQAMTALGMALSAHIQNAALGMLAAVGGMVVVWLLQVIVVIALVLILGVGLGGLLASVMIYASSPLGAALYILFACVVTALTIYGFYFLLEILSLVRVVRRIDKAH